jgi:hypothetical protein
MSLTVNIGLELKVVDDQQTFELVLVERGFG